MMSRATALHMFLASGGVLRTGQPSSGQREASSYPATRVGEYRAAGWLGSFLSAPGGPREPGNLFDQ